MAFDENVGKIMSSVFTQIINGKIPCYKIFENESVFAFLALDQIQLGHTLVVPKKEIDHFSDVPEPYYSEIFKISKVLSVAIKKASGCVRVGSLFAGFEVAHCHYHLVPLWKESDMSFTNASQRPMDEMKLIQKKIIEYLTF